MDQEFIILSEVCEDKRKANIIYVTYMWNLKNININ